MDLQKRKNNIRKKCNLIKVFAQNYILIYSDDQAPTQKVLLTSANANLARILQNNMFVMISTYQMLSFIM